MEDEAESIDSELAPGACVEVLATMYKKQGLNYEILKGWRGKVHRIDKFGSAIIDFDSSKGRRNVLQADLEYLKLIDKKELRTRTLTTQPAISNMDTESKNKSTTVAACSFGRHMKSSRGDLAKEAAEVALKAGDLDQLRKALEQARDPAKPSEFIVASSLSSRLQRSIYNIHAERLAMLMDTAGTAEDQTSLDLALQAAHLDGYKGDTYHKAQACLHLWREGTFEERLNASEEKVLHQRASDEHEPVVAKTHSQVEREDRGIMSLWQKRLKEESEANKDKDSVEESGIIENQEKVVSTPTVSDAAAQENGVINNARKRSSSRRVSFSEKVQEEKVQDLQCSDSEDDVGDAKKTVDMLFDLQDNGSAMIEL